MPKFSPKPGETVVIFSQRFTFQELPQAPGMVFSSEGAKGFVYQVKSDDGTRYGLKVFHKRYREERLVDSSRHLNRLGKHQGLLAAKRWIVLPAEDEVQKIPDLMYAVLMPWVPGNTWYECLGMAENHGNIFTLEQAKTAGANFLDIMESLERDSIAHTDISSANVIVERASLQPQLLDLEDIYTPDSPEPKQKTPGTAYYQHQKKVATWRPDGDRYATGILASEILLLANPSTARKASTAGFFQGTCISPEGQQRFAEAKQWLDFAAPAYGKVFEHTWVADSLENCPKISDLKTAFLKDRPIQVRTPDLPQQPVDERAQAAAAGASALPLPVRKHPWGDWAPKSPPFTWGQPPSRNVPPPVLSPPAPPLPFPQPPISAQPPIPPPLLAQQMPSGGRTKLIVSWVVAIILLVLVIVLLSRN